MLAKISPCGIQAMFRVFFFFPPLPPTRIVRTAADLVIIRQPWKVEFWNFTPARSGANYFFSFRTFRTVTCEHKLVPSTPAMWSRYQSACSTITSKVIKFQSTRSIWILFSWLYFFLAISTASIHFGKVPRTEK